MFVESKSPGEPLSVVKEKASREQLELEVAQHRCWDENPFSSFARWGSY